MLDEVSFPQPVMLMEVMPSGARNCASCALFRVHSFAEPWVWLCMLFSKPHEQVPPTSFCPLWQATCVPSAFSLAVLAKRSFPPPATTRLVETGYRDAPDVDSDMAIVFVKVPENGGGMHVLGDGRCSGG